MEVLLVYSQTDRQVAATGHHVAELLRRQGHEVYEAEVHKHTVEVLAPYDAIVLGGQLRRGRLESAIRNYLQENLEELRLKQVFLYVHSLVLDEEAAQALARHLPAELLSRLHSVNLGYPDSGMPSGNSPVKRLRSLLFKRHSEKPFALEQLETFVDLISEKRLPFQPN